MLGLTSMLYCQLSVSERLTLLQLIETEIKGETDLAKIMLAVESVLDALDVKATLAEVGQRIKMVSGYSLAQINDEHLRNSDYFEHLFPAPTFWE